MKSFRRHLPHFHPIGRPVFLTWRLHGSLPANRVFERDLTSGKAFVVMDRLLDRGQTGPLYLKRPEIAAMVVEAIEHHGEAMQQYELHALCRYPNHVHLLITPLVEMSKIMHSLKRFTARQANQMLGLKGTFWQQESYDRVVRDGEEFRKVESYILRNPVAAGLGESFPWVGVRPINNRPAGLQPAPQDHKVCDVC